MIKFSYGITNIGRVFADGAVISSGSLTVNPSNSHSFRIGAAVSPETNASKFNGSLTDIRVYNRFLATLELALLYRYSKTGNKNLFNYLNLVQQTSLADEAVEFIANLQFENSVGNDLNTNIIHGRNLNCNIENSYSKNYELNNILGCNLSCNFENSYGQVYDFTININTSIAFIGNVLFVLGFGQELITEINI